MADITKEIAKKDAKSLFESIGRFTSNGFVTTGEKGNTATEVKKIIEKYKNAADIKILESAYDQIYKTAINTTLKGEFTGLQRLDDRIKKLKAENPGKSQLELDLIDEGVEMTTGVKKEKGNTTQSLFERPFELYNKHKEGFPQRNPNADITLEEIKEKFQEGDSNNPLSVDDVEALDNTNAINLIINNKLPLTDEARGTLFNYLRFADKEKQDSFINTYYSEQEIKDYFQGDMQARNEMDSAEPEVPIEVAQPENIELDTPDAVSTEETTGEAEEITEETAEEAAEEVSENIENPQQEPMTRLQQAGKVGSSLLQGAAATLDAVGGPMGIVSYIMGKKGLKEAMKEIQPQARPELSPMFMEHFRQTKELSKKGFHPSEEMKFRKSLDKTYQIGLENAVRGSGGQRARFLAQSGVLDAQRSSALLDYAVKDDELQRKNQERYEKMMLFKENFDIQRTEMDRLEDMQRQERNKEAASKFTAAAFTNALSGLRNASFSGLVDSFLGNDKKDDFQLKMPTMPYNFSETNTNQNTEK